MICENCKDDHNGSYGSGRFCSLKCARGFSSKAKRNEINEKVSKIMKLKLSMGLKVGFAKINNNNIVQSFCEICGKEYTTRTYKNGLWIKTCSKECATKLRVKTYHKNTNKNVGGYRKGSGRGKSGWYKEYWCDSSYELAYVIYNLEHNIPFKRNTEGFKYIWKNKEHTYFPDYIVNEKYIEIKGYETKQNIFKYNAVLKPLIILRKKDLKYILDYVINKYGKDYIKLYTNNPYNDLTNHCKVCGKLCKKKNVYCSRECAGKGNNKHSRWK